MSYGAVDLTQNHVSSSAVDEVEFVGVSSCPPRHPHAIPHRSSSWPRLLSTISAEAVATIRGKGVVNYGDILVFLTPDSPSKSQRDSRFSKRPKKVDNAIRFCVRKPLPTDHFSSVGTPLPLPPPQKSFLGVGKLAPSTELNALRTLWQLKLIDIAGVVEYAPDNLNYFSSIIISLHVYALPALFDRCKPSNSANWVCENDDFDYVKLATFNLLRDLKIDKTATANNSNNFGGDQEEQLVNKFHLDQLYNSAQEEYIHLPEAEPPASFKSKLRPYQKQALEWMRRRELSNDEAHSEAQDHLHPLWKQLAFEDGTSFFINSFSMNLSSEFPKASPRARGGILADQMGMGKTVQTISLLCSVLPEDDWEGGKTLVVCTMSLLSQWRDEVLRHSDLSAELFYGADRGSIKLNSSDVFITTYQTLASEFFRHGTSSFLFQRKWFRVVLDEAHYIKSKTTHAAKAAFALEAHSRWCLTGTPVQNHLQDLFALLHFLREEPWGIAGWWRKMIEEPFMRQDSQALSRLQSILHPLMLRRTKDGRDAQGRPYLNLPERDDRVVLLKLSDVERSLYDALFSRSKATFDGLLAQGVVLNSYMHCLELLLRLRQVCDHPFLILPREQDAASVSQDVSRMIRAFRNRVDRDENSNVTDSFIQNLSKDLKENIKGLECPVCLDPPTEGVLTGCGHTLCRDCAFGLFNSKGFALCPICRTAIYRRELIQGIRQVSADDVVDFKKHWRHSSKTCTLLKLLKEFEQNKPGSKTVVFSQWTSMLDLCEIALQKEGLQSLRLDGTLRQSQREDVLNDFENSPTVSVLLCSLRVGGVGLNLVMASNVILLDIWWNPAVDEQAIDRVHRIGQKSTVNVRRLVVEESVEQRVLELQHKKKALANGALSEGSEEPASVRLENLMALFQGF